MEMYDVGELKHVLPEELFVLCFGCERKEETTEPFSNSVITTLLTSEAEETYVDLFQLYSN